MARPLLFDERRFRSKATEPAIMSHRIPRNLFLLGFGLLVGCISPTLPLPPPNRPDIEGPDAAGQVILSGNTRPSVFVYADNLSTGQSAGQLTREGDGWYRFKLGARVGDAVSMYYRAGLDESLPVEFVIPEPLGGGTGGSGGMDLEGAEGGGGGDLGGGGSSGS